MIRAFISVDISSEAKAALRFIVDELTTRIEGDNVRWVKSDNMHLTVKFLGNIEIDFVQSILIAMRTSVVQINPFQVALSQVGAFPSFKRSRVIWVGVQGDLQTLGMVRNNIENELQNLEFPKERRPFRPHITLGRVRGGDIHEGLDLSWATSWKDVRWLVRDVNLIRSTLTPSGPVYTKLGSITLQ